MPPIRGQSAKAVAVDIVRPLRGEVLRPGLALEESVYPGDDDPLALHAAVELGHGGSDVVAVVAVGSMLPEDPPAWLARCPGVATPVVGRWWRIRGMATAEAHRGTGVGRIVLDALLTHAADQGGGVAWCNARVPAVTFYLRAGFSVAGDEFDLPLIGPHRTMWRAVTPA